MDAIWKQIYEPLRDFIGKLPPRRRLTFAAMGVISIISIIALLVWAFRPQYRVLYSDLPLEDSNLIVELLKEENIPYRLEADGQRILVPADKLYELRLKMAGQGLPRQEGSGWEIFDKNNLGVTDFVQKLNFRRGLEGELARTILQLDPVEAARVHLVIPEERLFRERQKEPAASVTLKMKGRKSLTAAQVEGVSYLIASAVEGLTPEKVTVLDSRGYILSQPMDPNPVMRLSASQLEIQRQTENHLANKGQALLDRRFGPGRSSIQVTAEMDFQQREQTREIYDADNPAIRSEEIIVSSSTSSDTSASSNENMVTNYELNMTRETVVNAVGAIQRLTVAVMVDGNYSVLENPNGKEPVREFVALPLNELDEVTGLISSAVGLNAQRGDHISVVSVPFQDVGMIGADEFVRQDRWEMLFRYGQKIASFAAIALLLLILRNFLRKTQEIAGVRALAARELEAGALEEPAIIPPIEIDEEKEKRANLLQEQVKSYVSDKPDTAARLLRSWLLED